MKYEINATNYLNNALLVLSLKYLIFIIFNILSILELEDKSNL